MSIIFSTQDPGVMEGILGTISSKVKESQHSLRQFMIFRLFNSFFFWGEFDLIIFGRMSAYEPCNFYSPFGDRDHAVPQFYEEVYLDLKWKYPEVPNYTTEIWP